MLLCLAFHFPVNAQQVSFQLTPEDNFTQFDYQWQDQYRQIHQISFTISNQEQSFAANSLRHLSPERLQREIVRPLQSYARNNGWFQMEVKYDAMRKSISFHAHLRDEEEAAERIRTMQAQAEREVDRILSENYLTQLTLPPNLTGYAPDHVKIARESVSSLSPVSTAFYEYLGGASPRQYVEVIASFIQSIPYSELNDRLGNSGAGFLSPISVLFANQGDCDSKVTLLAAILRNLMPNLKMGIVYMPQHAAFAVAIPPEEGEVTVTRESGQLLVIEPTGPALLRIGESAPSSQMYLANGATTIRYFTPLNDL